MKKLLFATLSLVLSIASIEAQERIIEQSQLPKAAQSFLSTYYPSDKVSVATVERDGFDKDYSVLLVNGVKIEFDKNGDWMDVDCNKNYVPEPIVPTNIAKEVESRFPSCKIVKIERDKRYFEVELDNKVELKFNNKGELIEVDN
ncbi:MAG: PepSY-like domain-containing protein [Rikenellaceae bacterium]